jgi:hypothetical protein
MLKGRDDSEKRQRSVQVQTRETPENTREIADFLAERA